MKPASQFRDSFVCVPCSIHKSVNFHILLQAEEKVAEYNKLGRKLKLIPQSAENACGHDFEIRTDYSAITITQYKTQIQVQSLLPSIRSFFYLFIII